MNTNTNTNTNNHAQNTETHVKSGARKAGGAVLLLFGILLLILLSQPDARMAGAVFQSNYALANLIALGLLIGGIVLLCRGGRPSSKGTSAK